ncbi:MAG: class I SAM-dependent methyltransferase [Bacteroidetes bacterium]|nr:MAG: class I SAM-dependent methyltransferase [Bacteroidota bacterium]TAG89004.1 MAG: class I SAM-dependent methyltransferase [Bacteroidota bacterium]
MLENLTNCPVCEHDYFSPFLVCKDYTVSEKEFQIVACQNCDFKFTNPRPSAEEIGKYYHSDNYISHSNTKKGILAQIYQKVRKISLQAKLKHIQKESQLEKGSILDYGCGTGNFLKICQENNWEVTGIEPEEIARKQAEDLLKINIKENIFETELKTKSFDVITLWHVLEHIHLLDETIEKLRELLKPNGILLIAVPNCASADAKKWKEYWAAYDVPRHLYHFTPQTLPLLLKKHSIKIDKYMAMPYDSYYISLLSRKYKTGKLNFLNGFFDGLQSNQWAKKNSLNFSSVLYVCSCNIANFPKV